MDFNKILRHPATVPVAVGVISFGAGVVGGFFLGKKYVQDDATQKVVALGHAYDEALEEHGVATTPLLKVVIDENHPALQKDEPKRELTSQEYLAKRTQDILDSRPSLEEGPPVTELITTNVFDIEIPGWDYDVEKRNRDSGSPYVLHREEFFAREMGLSQKTLIYYEGDNTLATDEQPPQVLYEISDVIGDIRFGHGSGEDHVFYVRNERRREEYEVLKEEGSFEIAKLGFEPEDDGIQHSAPRRFPRQE